MKQNTGAKPKPSTPMKGGSCGHQPMPKTVVGRKPTVVTKGDVSRRMGSMYSPRKK